MLRRTPLPVLGAVVLSVLFVHAAVAQRFIDPNDRLYTHLEVWERRGLVTPLPHLRPYPHQVVTAALAEVISNGSEDDRLLAEEFLRRIDGPHVVGRHSSTFAAEYVPEMGIRADSAGTIVGQLSHAATARFVVRTESETAPIYVPPAEPLVSGPTFEMGEASLRGAATMAAAFAVGDANLYGQAGLIQSSFGPTVEGALVIGSRAPAAGHFAVVYRADRLTLTGLLLELSARTAATPTGELISLRAQSGSGYQYPSKFLVLHSIDYRLLDWLRVGVLQAVLYGDRFSPLYLLPLPVVFTELFLGNYDNELIGGTVQLKAPAGITLDLTLLVDDFDFVTLQQLSLDSAQNKFALHASVAWQPAVPLLAQLRADYQMVTPYTYTHSSHPPIGYLTYTHRSEPLGATLPPNSDALAARVLLRPLSFMDLELHARYIRHGNGSDHGAGSVDGDGSIWDDGYTSNGNPTFTGQPSTFLTQDVLETTLQIGLAVRAGLPTTAVRGDVFAGYTFQHVTNRNLDPSAGTQIDHFVEIGFELGI